MVETYLDSYRSPFYNVKTPFGYDSFTSTFGIKTVVAQVKKAPRYSRVDFLRAISASGTHIMLKPFLDAGVDVDEGGTLNNYLGSAARNEKLESFHMLLDANANTALALPDFLYSRDLSSQSGKHFLSTLFENVRPTTLHKLDDDPLLALVGYEEVLQKCPRALHILLENGAFHNCGLYGGRDVNADESNMLKAILYNWSHAVELFLDHGAEANIQIGQLYTASEPYHETITQYTWLTLAVEAGRARCAEILIKYGAKITYPDGSGTTALQLAHDNIDCEHPRKFSLDRYQSYLVEAAEDIEILEVLERGLAGESERTKPSAGSYRATSKSSPRGILPAISWANQSNLQGGLPSVITGSVKGFLRTMNTWTRVQQLRSIFRKIQYDQRQLSRLSFRDALLVRLCYVISYCLLLFFEVSAIAVWLAEVPRPPRALLIGAVMLVLAVIWGLSLY